MQIKSSIVKQISYIKYNLLYTIIISIAFIIVETVHRMTNISIDNFISIKNYLEIFIILFLFSFTNGFFRKFIIYLLVAFVFFEMAHYNYFGSFIFPFEIILLFTKSNEVFETLVTVNQLMVVPYSLTIILLAIVYFSHKKIKYLQNSNKFTYLIIIVLVVGILKGYFNVENNQLGSRPNLQKSYIKNSLYLYKYFFSKTLPNKIFNIEIVERWEGEKFKKIIPKKEPIKNIIFIIGESLSAKYMNLYGHNLENTPYLNSLVGKKNFYYKKAISAGTFTDTSVPMILNIAKQPNSIKHMLSQNSNLFKMAKESNYNTSFISSQARDGFSYIRPYMGLKFIDFYIDPTTEKKLTIYDSFQDDFLIKMMNKYYKKENNDFMVLNMIGSHEPYGYRYPSKFDIFKKDDLVGKYNNSVLYSDFIFKMLIEKYLLSTKEKTVIIFTSDHGQHVGENGYGKGNLNIKSDYIVPFFIYSNFKLDSNINQYLNKSNYISHYNISKLVGYMLGYNCLNSYSFDAFINSGNLNGNAGYLKVNFDEKSILDTKIY